MIRRSKQGKTRPTTYRRGGRPAERGGMLHQLRVAESSLRFTKRSFFIGLVVTTLLTAVSITTPLMLGQERGDARYSDPADAIIEVGDNSADNPVYVIPEEVSSLGTPPAYTPDLPGTGEYHCDDWFTWLDKKGAAPIFGEAYIFIAAPADAEVSVVDVGVRLLKKQAAPATLVQCLYGAGGYEATPASVDLDAPSPELVVKEDQGDVVVKVGSGQYKTSAGSSDIIRIEPTGSTGFMYEWRLTVKYVVNARQVTEVSRPFRSYIRGPLVTAQLTAYDYDHKAQKWVRVAAVAG